MGPLFFTADLRLVHTNLQVESNQKISECLVILILQRLNKKTQNFRYFVKDQKQHFTNFAKSRCTFSGVAHCTPTHTTMFQNRFQKSIALFIMFMPVQKMISIIINLVFVLTQKFWSSTKCNPFLVWHKVIYPKYSKH